MAEPDESAERGLRRIADILGIPVAQLRDGVTPAEFADTDECLRLWYQLRTDAGRAVVLDCLRQALADEIR